MEHGKYAMRLGLLIGVLGMPATFRLIGQVSFNTGGLASSPIPRMIGIQARGAAPLAVGGPKARDRYCYTIGSPVNAKRRWLLLQQGDVLAVSDEEI